MKTRIDQLEERYQELHKAAIDAAAAADGALNETLDVWGPLAEAADIAARQAHEAHIAWSDAVDDELVTFWSAQLES